MLEMGKTGLGGRESVGLVLETGDGNGGHDVTARTLVPFLVRRQGQDEGSPLP